MNAQAFSELIQNPALLGNYTLWELQELAQEYPYSSAVYSLVALKARLEGDGNYEHHLNQAALRIADRKKLFELIHADYEPVQAETVQPVAEKPLPFDDDFETVTLEQPAEDTTFVASPSQEVSEPEKPATETELSAPSFTVTPQENSPVESSGEETAGEHTDFESAIMEEPESVTDESESITEELSPETPPAVLNTAPPASSIVLPGADEVLEALDGLTSFKTKTPDITEDAAEDAVVEKAHKEVRISPEPVSGESNEHSFSEWLSLLSKGKPQPQPEEPEAPKEEFAMNKPAPEPEPASPAATSEEEKEIEEIIITRQAKASLSQDDELVTETLAKIYELQKKYDKAIKAYQTLSLKYPDKRAYFADKIEKLKNK